MSDPMTPQDAQDALEQEASQAASLVMAARRLLSEGRFLDLGALEARVAQFCKHIALLPKDEGGRFADFLDELNGELGALAQDIETRCDRLAVELGGVNANSAYRRLD